MLRPKIRALFDKFAAAETAFCGREFLAPVLRGGMVLVRIAGVICSLRITHRTQGWSIFRVVDHQSAEWVRPATMLERQRYLEQFPARRWILFARHGRTWLAWPAQQSDTRFGRPELVHLHLATEVQAFDTVLARFDGSRWWFDTIDERADPTIGDYLRQSFAKDLRPEFLTFPKLSQEARLAYAAAFALQNERGRNRYERRLRGALAHAGAEFRSYSETADHLRVEFTLGGIRRVCSVHREDLSVHLAGICLSGEDAKFDLASLVSVLRESDAEDVVRIGPDGLAEERYWEVHPPRL